MGAQSKGNEKQDSSTAAPAESSGGSASGGRRSSRSRTASGYSGRILVRMPSELHEQLAHAAEREDVSLNRYVNEALSSSIESLPSPEEASNGTERAGADDRDAGSARLSTRGVRLALATNLVVVVIAALVAVVLLVLALQRGI